MEESIDQIIIQESLDDLIIRRIEEGTKPSEIIASVISTVTTDRLFTAAGLFKDVNKRESIARGLLLVKSLLEESERLKKT